MERFILKEGYIFDSKTQLFFLKDLEFSEKICTRVIHNLNKGADFTAQFNHWNSVNGHVDKMGNYIRRKLSQMNISGR